MKNSLTNEKYWAKAYENRSFIKVSDDHPIRKWLNTYLPNGNGTCLEIGAYPGQFIEIFGEKGYELNGIDLVEDVKFGLPEWLKDCGHKVDKFEQKDFLNWKTDEKFDVVCSFGFIEHFKNFKEVVKKQISLVKENGYIVIEVPNFRGPVQRFLHYYLDNDNYRHHNISSMNIKILNDLIKEEGFEIIYEGYFGPFIFWCEGQERNQRQQKLLQFIVENSEKLKEKYKGDNYFYSPFAGVIGRKVK